MSKIQYEIHSHVAIIELNNPPLNTLDHGLRKGIAEGIHQANQDDSVQIIVLIGNEKAFSGGADIHEFDRPEVFFEPDLRKLIQIVESSPKPIICALSGICFGGGLELVLGAHYRIAQAEASLGLPEVKIGLLPGAGGTQRLPRLVGVEKALDMIISGNPVPAIAFKDTDLIDEIVPGNLPGIFKEEALLFAQKVLAEKRPRKITREMNINFPNAGAFFQQARHSISLASKNFPAPLKCLDAVEASVLRPFDEGMQFEMYLMVFLFKTPESSSLRHLFFAERACSKIHDVPKDTPIRNIQKIAVIGAGTMGGGISMNFLSAGFPVTIIENHQAALDRGVATIRKNYENSMKKGKLTPEKVEQFMGLLRPSLNFEDIKEADLVIEAVFEKMEIKEEVFKKMDAMAKPGAILATNTSTLDVNHLARVTGRPQDVLGMHFFSPANVMKLLEVVRGAATGKDVLATIMQLGKKIKKVAVVSGVCDGFIGNRMIHQYGAMANELVEQGASPAQVDQAMENWGMAMGPFRMADLAGNDIGRDIRKEKYAKNPSTKQFFIADALCELGRFGQKTRAGWYRYEPGGREPLPDPVVDQLIQDCRQKAGVIPRKFSDEEIVERCLSALVNEGAKILEEGIAARASDIDIIYLYGYGFPAFRGGPMHYANSIPK